MVDIPFPESSPPEDASANEATLADGRRWRLASPALRLKPYVVENVDEFGRRSVTVETVAEVGFPPPLKEAVERLLASAERGTTEEIHDAFFSTAAALLRSTHDVDSSTAAALLDVPDEVLPALVASVLSSITGVGRSPERLVETIAHEKS